VPVKGRSNRLLLPALSLIVLLTLAALLAPVLAPSSPTAQDLTGRFQPSTKEHILGTDDLGRDILSRVIYGSRPALLVGFVSVGIAVAVGLTAGLAAGLAGGWTDNVLMLLMDALLSFPAILLAITVVAFLGQGLTQVMVAIGFIFSPVFARLVRAEVLALKEEGYVEASRALGTGEIRILLIHILPNLLGKVVVQASVSFALAVVIEASLSYLGLGTQPPQPSWGGMLKDARTYLLQAPGMAIYPGIAVALTVLSFNILGDSLSERLNPRLGPKGS
jgi:peptide/nickel transport system permease protein